MRVFISWQKDPSQKIAFDFKEWIPSVLHNIEPWMSEKNISAIICSDNRKLIHRKYFINIINGLRYRENYYDHCRRLLSFRRCRIRS